jgi:hypothetical protein
MSHCEPALIAGEAIPRTVVEIASVAALLRNDKCPCIVEK